LVAVPFGASAVAEWVGILWPYHRRGLRWRWEKRHAHRRTMRWLVLVVSPFIVVPALIAVSLACGIAAGAAIGGRDASGHLDTTGLTVAAALSIFVAGVAFFAAPRVSTGLAGKRRTVLTRTLRDPDLG
jgi:hypothetical protein